MTLSVLAAFLLLTGESAFAKRMGGGKSVGRQSSNVSQRESSGGSGAETAGGPARDAGDTSQRPGQRSNINNPGQVQPTPNMAPPRRSIGGAVVGGIAAALGFAWLSRTIGFGDALGDVMVIALIFGGLLWLWTRWQRAKLAQSAPFARANASFQFQGGRGVAPQAPAPAYRPENVGNDASARPFERSSLGELGAHPVAPAALAQTTNWQIPADFDSYGFLNAAKSNFITLQAAWDRADIPALRSMMTDGMLAEIQSQLAEREGQAGAGINSTDVVMLDARLLGIEELPNEYLASVEFSGMIREEASAGASPFREVWNMSKSRSGSSGWLVAGVQALQ